MPVHVVALRAPEVLLRLPHLDRVVEDAAPRELLGHDEHPLVEGVRLRIFRQEVPPRRQRDQRREVVLQRVARLGEAPPGGSVEGPLTHLVIRAPGQVHAARGLLEDPRVLERRRLDEVRLCDLGEEVLEPAVLVNALVRPWPGAELLAVVRIDDQLRPGGVALAQLLHGLPDIAERDEIAEPRARGVEDEREPLVLGDERLAQLLAP